MDVFNDDMTRRFVRAPFRHSYIKDISEDDDRIFCLAAGIYGNSEKAEITEIAVYDKVTGDEINRGEHRFRADEINILPTNNVLVVQNGAQIWFLDAKTLNLIWYTKPYYIPEFKQVGFFKKRQTIVDYVPLPSNVRPLPLETVQISSVPFEDEEGKVWCFGTSDLGRYRYCGVSVGFFLFNLSTQSERFHAIDRTVFGTPTLFGPSQNGRFALRRAPRWCISPMTEIGHDPKKTIWFKDKQHFDLWSVKDQKPIKSIHISDLPVGSKTKEDQFEENKLALRKIAQSVQQMAKDPFRMVESPVIEEEKTDTLFGVFEELYNFQAYPYDERIFWEEDNQAFWVVQYNSLRRVELSGKRSPLFIFDRYIDDEYREILSKRPNGLDIAQGEASTHRSMPSIKSLKVNNDFVEIVFNYGIKIIRFSKNLAFSNKDMILLKDAMLTILCAPPITMAEISHQMSSLVHIGSWQTLDIKKALFSTTQKILQFPSSIMDGGVFSPIFKVGSEFYQEKQFIEQLIDRKIGVTQEVTQLIDALLKVVREGADFVIDGDEKGIGPLCYFLEYIADHDDIFMDRIRHYCNLRDSEHENYSRDTILKNYLDQRGFVSPDLWRLGIYYTSLFSVDGFHSGKSDWLHTGILAAAREKLDPHVFVQYIEDETTKFGFVDDRDFKSWKSYLIDDLIEQLTEAPWDKQLKALVNK